MSEITNEPLPGGSSPGMVSKKELDALSANFFSRVQILDTDGSYRQIDCSDPKDPKKNDSKSIYFDKARIDALFAANPGSDGLKIYLGLHDSKIFECEAYYENKMMVVLVATTGGVDNLNDTADFAAKSAATAEGGGGGGGEGLDQGKICPPYPGC